MNGNAREILRRLRDSMASKGQHAWKSQDFRGEMQSHLDTLIRCHGHSECGDIDAIKQTLDMWAVRAADGSPALKIFTE